MSSKMKKRAVVICPGRGTYTKETLGYLRGNKQIAQFLADIDARRKAIGEPTISELDSADVFKPQVHTKGEHASSLIYTCAMADFMAIDREQYDIVAVTGNSMGWYLTLALGGSLDWAGGFAVVNGMGSMMKDEIIGGQVIYPVCDDNWVMSKSRREQVEKIMRSVNAREGMEAYVSIELGGYIVLGANKPALPVLLKELPAAENYPFQLINHAAFHTPLLRSTSDRAFSTLSRDLFHAPAIPLIDGRGCIWQPYSPDIDDLYHYTLGHQVVEPFDFTAAISVALKEFAPDCLILLGPGSTLGGSIGQIMIANDWGGLKSKAQFTQTQSERPFLLAMGRAEQRALVQLQV